MSDFSTIIKIGMNSSDFERSASEVNRQVKVLDSGFKAVASEARAFGETTDTLQKKSQILSEKINIQNDKVLKLKDAYEKSKKETGENSKETDRLAVQYNKAIGEMNSMQGALNKIDKELDDTEKGFKDNGDAVDKFAEKSKKMEKLKTTLKAVGVGVVALSAALIGGAKNFADMTDNIDKSSQKLGLSREAYQEYAFVLSQAGVDIDSMATGMKTLTGRMQESIEGAGMGAELFEKLGITITDSMSQEEAFDATLKALQGMEDGVEKAALAQDLFGKSGQNLLPLLNGTAESTEELKKQARELGLVLSDEAIDSGVQLTDTMDQMKRSLSAVAAQGLSAVMPLLNSLASELVKLMPLLQPIIEQLASSLVPILGTLTTTLLPIFIMLFEALMPILPTLASLIVTLVEGLAPFLVMVAELIAELLPPLADLFSELMQGLLPPLIEVTLALAEAFMPLLELVLPLLVDALRLVATVFTALQPVITGFIDILAKVITYVVSNFVGNFIAGFTKIKENFFSIWNAIKSFFTGIWDGIIKTLTGNISSIFRIINKLIDKVNAISFTIPGIPGITESKKIGFNIPKLKLPSYKVGIDYVPTNRIAQLHEGERVLTKEQNLNYMKNGKNNSSNSNLITGNNFYIREESDIKKVAKELFNLQKRSDRGLGLA